MTSLLNIAGNIPVVEAGGQSLRFEDGDSAYLSWTPASAGTRTTWTWSGWAKRGEITKGSGSYGLFGCNPSGEDIIRFDGTSNFNFYVYTGGYVGQLNTTGLHRDSSAWYHIVCVWDTTNATSTERMRLYINGTRVTTFNTATYPSLNAVSNINTSTLHRLGNYNGSSTGYYDGYLANVCFIDGQALDPTSFGEYDDTLWKPKSDTDIQALTFGTNGFYLPFKQTTEAEGFSTVTYTGTSSQQAIEGVGFSPDLVWLKARSSTGYDHVLQDSVRGSTKQLYSNSTSAEVDDTDAVTSFDSSGFTTGADVTTNNSGVNYVAWCWDAGSGSAVSNTDGSITSSVKANTAKGFSIVSYTGNGTAGATIGHGLSSAPDMIIAKQRSSSGNNWAVYHQATGNNNVLFLNSTSAQTSVTDKWASSSSTFAVNNATDVNASGSTYIAYCFHSVSGYSSIGSYSGTGATGNSITGLGFKPAFVVVKRTDSTGNWVVRDNTRSPVNPADDRLFWNLSNSTGAAFNMDFDSDGFTLNTATSDENASGGTYIYMAFADTRDATFFGDTSGNGNNWTPNALNNTDVVPDSPVSGGNFATMNPLWQTLGTVTHSEGNLKTTVGANAHQAAVSTFTIPSTGKWYWEMRLDSKTYSTYTYGYGGVGATTGSSNAGDPSSWVTDGTQINWRFPNNASYNKVYGSGSINLFGATDQFADGDIISFAYDADNKRLYLAQNGSWFLSADPSTNTADSTAIWYGWSDAVAGTHQFFEYWGYFTYVTSKNFGQDSSFIGQVTPQGNTDDNGVGDFYYAPPSGYLALTTGNLPAATITAPDEYHGTLLFSGNGSTQSITGLGWQPDFTWIKMRSDGTRGHALFDAVRGGTERLDSSATQEGRTNEGNISFDADGFSVTSSHPTVNDSGDSAVAWNWLAGNGTVSNTDGSITSTVSVNTTSGFSIITYTGDGSASASSVGHGLSQTPDMVILKDRGNAVNWFVWHNDGSTTRRFEGLNTTNASTSPVYYSADADTINWSGSTGDFNGSGKNYVMYAFHSVDGYSKCGSYTGNGSSDGTFVHCGFRPSLVLVKRTDAAGENWEMWDKERGTYNLNTPLLYANLSNAETGNASRFDALSNGFKIRTTNAGVNASGGSYIFLAFAEAPFKSANAR